MDDEEEICDFIKEKLEREFEVETALTGESAIEIFSKYSFDVYVFDLRLSTSTTGIDVIKKCREIYPDAKIIAMTGYVDQNLKQEAFDAGISHYALKPSGIQPDEIYKKVCELL